MFLPVVAGLGYSGNNVLNFFFELVSRARGQFEHRALAARRDIFHHNRPRQPSRHAAPRAFDVNPSRNRRLPRHKFRDHLDSPANLVHNLLIPLRLYLNLYRGPRFE